MTAKRRSRDMNLSIKKALRKLTDQARQNHMFMGFSYPNSNRKLGNKQMKLSTIQNQTSNERIFRLSDEFEGSTKSKRAKTYYDLSSEALKTLLAFDENGSKNQRTETMLNWAISAGLTTIEWRNGLEELINADVLIEVV